MQCVNVMIKRVCNVFRFFICMLDFYSVRYKIWIDRIITFLGGMEGSSYFSGCFFFFANFRKRMKWKQFWPMSFEISSRLQDLPAFWRIQVQNIQRDLETDKKTKKDQSISNRCEINIRFIDNKKYLAVQTQQMNNCRVIYFI